MREYLIINDNKEKRKDIKKIVGCLLDIKGLTARKSKALEAYVSGSYVWKEYRDWISKELDQLDDVLKQAYNRNEKRDKEKTSYKDWLNISYDELIDTKSWLRKQQYKKYYVMYRQSVSEKIRANTARKKYIEEQEFRREFEAKKLAGKKD